MHPGHGCLNTVSDVIADGRHSRVSSVYSTVPINKQTNVRLVMKYRQTTLYHVSVPCCHTMLSAFNALGVLPSNSIRGHGWRFLTLVITGRVRGYSWQAFAFTGRDHGMQCEHSCCPPSINCLQLMDMTVSWRQLQLCCRVLYWTATGNGSNGIFKLNITSKSPQPEKIAGGFPVALAIDFEGMLFNIICGFQPTVAIVCHLSASSVTWVYCNKTYKTNVTFWPPVCNSNLFPVLRDLLIASPLVQ